MGENEEKKKGKFKAGRIKLPPRGTLVKGQSALCWLWQLTKLWGKSLQKEAA